MSKSDDEAARSQEEIDLDDLLDGRRLPCVAADVTCCSCAGRLTWNLFV